ncbi:MAG TPA: type III-B CRISPR module RAMP protein Cmr4 [Nitrospirae bacterium]|nr:type III-B CRISPR module RAMP protein Cmr4 [Nitrospirota bacterium]
MYSKHSIVGMYCETPLHAGSGQAIGAVDLPIQREKTTGWPTVQASGLKGAFRDAYQKSAKNDITSIFGSDNSGDKAGAISIGDARVLLFPIRSSITPFLWVTCPAILRKLKRDGKIIGLNSEWTIPGVTEENYLGLNENAQDIIFEDLLLSGGGKIDEEIIKTIQSVMPPDNFYNTENIKDFLCIISDKNYSMLVEIGTEIHARIQLTEQKTSNNLWYQELLPSNTILYTIVSMMDERKKVVIKNRLKI